MLFFSLFFMFVIGAIAFVAVVASLFTPVPFFPFIFPLLFAAVTLAGLLAAPHIRRCTTLSDLTPRQTFASPRTSWLYIIIVPAVFLLLFAPGIQFGYHGLFHSAYVYEILRGLPPENVTLPGYPANDYWPYHVYLALLSRLLDAPPPFVSALSNIFILGMCLLWSSALWKLLAGPAASSALDVLFPLLGANLFYLPNLFLARQFLLPAVWQPDPRLDFSLVRFINFNGFSLGILFFLAAFFTALKILREGETRRDASLLIFLGGSALLFHATTGVYLFAALIPCLIVTRLLDRSRPLPSASFLTQNGFALVGWLLLSGLFLLPAALFLLRSAAAMEVKTTLELFSPRDMTSIFVMIYPAIPFFILAATRAWKEKQTILLFPAVLALWGFLLALFVRLPDGNEYKFIYLSSIAFLMVALMGMKDFASRFTNGGRAVLIIAVTALVANTLVGTWTMYDVYSRRHNVRVTYHGAHVTLDRPDFAPFAWIRENTPPETVILQPLTSKDWNYGYFSERLPYVVAGHIYNEGIPAAAARIAQVNRLYDPAVPIAERIAVVEAVRLSLNRPIAVLYSADPAFRSAMELRFGVMGEALGDQTYIFLLDAP
ncbi:MAG: hypothetical protein HFACDABA_02649 [Anaerolineales bacterium]|nr:hypothetical protein [Anaerolineales bacterium]